MDVFAFRNQIVEDYERFSRSFVKIRAEDIRRTVDDAYSGGRFCPDPLIQLNPNFVKGGSIDELASPRRPRRRMRQYLPAQETGRPRRGAASPSFYTATRPKLSPSPNGARATC